MTTKKKAKTKSAPVKKTDYKEFIAIAPVGEDPTRENSKMVAVAENYYVFNQLFFDGIEEFGTPTIKDAKNQLAKFWDEYEEEGARIKADEDLAEAERVQMLAKQEAKPSYCTRELFHDGPCNGLPHSTCEVYKQETEPLVIKNMPVVVDPPSTWERLKKLVGC